MNRRPAVRCWLTLLCLVLMLGCGQPPIVKAADGSLWTVDIARDATATIRYDGVRVMSFKYIAWGDNWKYATVKAQASKSQDDSIPFSGECGPLETQWKGSASWKDNGLAYDWLFVNGKETSGNIGGALAYDVRIDPAIFDADKIPDPTVNSDEKGWSWTPLPGQTLSVTFDNLPGKVAFEKGHANNIRAWIIPGTQKAGERKMSMTISLPAGAKYNGLMASRYAEFDPKKWTPDTLDWNVSPVDLSYLNDKPAGKHGMVKAVGDHFEFADGSPIKFWGCNVAAYALFNATNEAIEQQAKRLAAMGYNLVRIHHHDSASWSPSVFVKDATDTQHLDPKQLDRIDYWVKCLEDQGIYVWIDLHVGRPFLVGDQINGFDELMPYSKGGRMGKGFNYVDDRITQLMKDFAKAYLTHPNPYTKQNYLTDPAVMGVLITNENDITDHFGNNFLPDKKAPIHRPLFETMRNSIIKARGLDAKTAWMTWLPGQSKVVLNEVQYNWSKDFIDYLRGLGLKAPIATTNTWGSDPLFSLPSLTVGDMIDVHSYGVAESITGNPKADDNLTTWIAAAQVLDKPVTITEWNTPFPAKDRFVIPMYLAAEASLQGWDAPMLFTYQQAPLVTQTKLSEWTTSNDPAITATMPAAALMYRRGDVAPAKTTAVLALSVENLMYKKVSPETSRAIRTLAEQHKLAIAMPDTPLMPWLTPSKIPGDAKVITDASANTLPPDAKTIDSDTGELSRDWKSGTFTINSPLTQAATGWIGGKEIALTDVSVKVDTNKASVVVSSLDGQPIASSKKMLLTVIAQVGSTGKTGSPVYSEPVGGTLTFKTPLAAATEITPKGGVGAAMKVDGNTVEIPAAAKTHWFLLTR